MKPRPASGKTVLEIIPATDLSVFSSSARSGVDIVILADCSGSMGTKDLTDSSDQVPGKGFSFFSKARAAEYHQPDGRACEEL
jgi:hypothetical protein